QELDHRQSLVRRTVRIRFLPPFELAVEEIAVYVQVDFGCAIADSCRRQPRFRGVRRLDDGIRHCLGGWGSPASQTAGVRAVGMSRRDDEILSRASSGFRRSRW